MSSAVNYKIYSGLSKDLNSFAKYLYIYESQIKVLNSLNEFSSNFQNASYYFSHSIQHYLRYASKDELNEKKVLVEKGKQTLFFTKSKVQVLDFCRHLRNSFSHALIEKNAENLNITDCKGKTTTSKGYIKYSLIKEFIVKLIAEYEI